MKDYYYILGIKKEASMTDVKNAYRKLSLKFHPDKNDGDPFFEERFKEILEAYETLSSTFNRSSYDNNFTFHNKTYNGYNFDPLIEYFRANKSAFEHEEEVTFSWKTINADKVSIKQFGIVQPIGQKTYKIRNFKNSYLSFELLAENLNTGRQVKQILKLDNKTYQEQYQYFKRMFEIENKTSKKNGESKGERTNSKKPTKEFKTDKGIVSIELNFVEAIPAVNNKVYQNNVPAKDDKYKLGFMNYIVVVNGIINDLTNF